MTGLHDGLYGEGYMDGYMDGYSGCYMKTIKSCSTRMYFPGLSPVERAGDTRSSVFHVSPDINPTYCDIGDVTKDCRDHHFPKTLISTGLNRLHQRSGINP